MEMLSTDAAVELLQLTLENTIKGNIEPWDMSVSAEGLSLLEWNGLEMSWQQRGKTWQGHLFPLDAARFCPGERARLPGAYDVY
jgi:hypothetical protein